MSHTWKWCYCTAGESALQISKGKRTSASLAAGKGSSPLPSPARLPAPPGEQRLWKRPGDIRTCLHREAKLRLGRARDSCGMTLDDE